MATTTGTAAYGREMKIEGSGKTAAITVGSVRFRLDKNWRNDYYDVEAHPVPPASMKYNYGALCEIGAERGYNTPRTGADRYRKVGAVHPKTVWRESGTEYTIYKRGDRSALPTITPVEGDQYRKLTDAFAAVVAEYVATPAFRSWCREIDLLVATYAAEAARAEAEAEADRAARTTTAMGITIERHPSEDDPSATEYYSRESLYGYGFRATATDGGGATVEMWNSGYPNRAWAIGTVVPAGSAFAVVTEMHGVSPHLPSLRFPTVHAAAEYLIRERALDRDRLAIERSHKYEAEIRAQCEAERAKLNAKLAAKTAERDTYAARFAAAGGA